MEWNFFFICLEWEWKTIKKEMEWNHAKQNQFFSLAFHAQPRKDWFDLLPLRRGAHPFIHSITLRCSLLLHWFHFIPSTSQIEIAFVPFHSFIHKLFCRASLFIHNWFINSSIIHSQYAWGWALVFSLGWLPAACSRP